MTYLGSRFGGILIFFVSLGLAFGLIGLLYYFNVEQNEEYQNQLHLRELRNISTSINNGVDQLRNASRTVSSAESQLKSNAEKRISMLEEYELTLDEVSWILVDVGYEARFIQEKLTDYNQTNVDDLITHLQQLQNQFVQQQVPQAQPGDSAFTQAIAERDQIEQQLKSISESIITLSEKQYDADSPGYTAQQRFDDFLDNLPLSQKMSDDVEYELGEMCDSSPHCSWAFSVYEKLFSPEYYEQCVLTTSAASGESKTGRRGKPKSTEETSHCDKVLSLDVDQDVEQQLNAFVSDTLKAGLPVVVTNIDTSVKAMTAQVNELNTSLIPTLEVAVTNVKQAVVSNTDVDLVQLSAPFSCAEPGYLTGNLCATFNAFESTGPSEEFIEALTDELNWLRMAPDTLSMAASIFGEIRDHLKKSQSAYIEDMQADISFIGPLKFFEAGLRSQEQQRTALERRLNEVRSRIAQLSTQSEYRQAAESMAEERQLAEVLFNVNDARQALREKAIWLGELSNELYIRRAQAGSSTLVAGGFRTLEQYQQILYQSFVAFSPCLQGWSVDNDCGERLMELQHTVSTQLASAIERELPEMKPDNDSLQNLMNSGFNLRNAKVVSSDELASVYKDAKPGAVTVFTEMSQLTSRAVGVIPFANQQDSVEQSTRFVQVPLLDLMGSETRLHPVVLLVDQEGEVLARKDNVQIDAAPSGVNFEHLNSVLTKLFSKHAEQIDTTRKVSKDTSDKQNTDLQDHDAIPGYSGMLDVHIAGADYRLFITPFSHQQLRLHTAQTDEHQQHFYLIGLKSKEQLTSQKLAISDTQVAMASGSFLLLVSLLPLLKVRLVSAQQCLSKLDRMVIWSALVVLISILSVGWLAVSYYDAERQSMTARSAAISNQITERFSEELRQIRDIVRRQAELLADLKSRDLNEGLSDAWFNFADEQGQQVSSAYWLENLFAMPIQARDGLFSRNDPALWSTRQFFRTSPNIDISSREYYRRARDCQLWQSSVIGDNATCAGIYMQRLFNLRDGRITTQFAQRMSLNGQSHVASFGTKLRTFFSTVMPANYGFIVFDNATGIVQYHSDDTRSLVENIFVETDNDQSLKALINNPNQAAKITQLTVTYGGEQFEFTVAPLHEGFPLTLVVFYDKSEHQSLTLLKAIGTLVLVVLSALLLVTVVYVAQQIWRVLKNRSSQLYLPPTWLRFSYSSQGAGWYSLYLTAIIVIPTLLISFAITYSINQTFNRYIDDYHQSQLASRVQSAQVEVDSYRKRVIEFDYVNLLKQNPGALVFSGKQAEQPEGQFCRAINNLVEDKVIDSRASSWSERYVTWLLTVSKLDDPVRHQLLSQFLGKQPLNGERQALALDNCQYPFGYSDKAIPVTSSPSWFAALLQLLLAAALIIWFGKIIFCDWVAKRFLGAHVPDHFRSGDRPKPLLDKPYIQLVRPTREYINEHVLQSATQEIIGGDMYHVSTFFNGISDPARAITEFTQNNAGEAMQYVNDGFIGFSSPQRLVLKGMEDIAFDRRVRTFVLDVLEQLMTLKNLQVILLCEVAPLYRMTQQSAYPGSCERVDYASASERVRWANLLRQFGKQYVVTAKPKNRLHQFFAKLQVLRHEVTGWPELADIGDDFWQYHKLHKDPDIDVDTARINASLRAGQSMSLPHQSEQSLQKYWESDQIIEFFSAQAGPFYRYRWELCTKAERMLLLQLAIGRQPNPLNLEPLEHLTRRGYIFRDNGWHIVNESFRRFVLTAEEPQQVKAWLAEIQEGTWQMLRIPLFMLVIALLAIMVYTATDAVESALGIMTAILGLIPLAIRNVTLFKSMGSGDSQ